MWLVKAFVVIGMIYLLLSLLSKLGYNDERIDILFRRIWEEGLPTYKDYFTIGMLYLVCATIIRYILYIF